MNGHLHKNLGVISSFCKFSFALSFRNKCKAKKKAAAAGTSNPVSSCQEAQWRGWASVSFSPASAFPMVQPRRAQRVLRDTEERDVGGGRDRFYPLSTYTGFFGGKFFLKLHVFLRAVFVKQIFLCPFKVFIFLIPEGRETSLEQ